MTKSALKDVDNARQRVSEIKQSYFSSLELECKVLTGYGQILQDLHPTVFGFSSDRALRLIDNAAHNVSWARENVTQVEEERKPLDKRIEAQETLRDNLHAYAAVRQSIHPSESGFGSDSALRLRTRAVGNAKSARSGSNRWRDTVRLAEGLAVVASLRAPG